MAKSFALIYALVFLALMVSLITVAYCTYITTNIVSANQAAENIGAVRNTYSALNFFVNNVFVSIFSIVPFVGAFAFSLVWFNTSRLMGELAYFTNVHPLTYFGHIFIPVGLLEFAAYALVITEGFFLTFALNNKTLRERLKTRTWIILLLYFGLLAIAAIVEATLIG